jgi:hypothetical protein
MPDEAAVKTYDAEAHRAFNGAYSEWLAARAALEEPGDRSDAEGNRRFKRRADAEVALMATPAPFRDAVWMKFELVEHLVIEERLTGESAYPLFLLALASLKADLFRVGLGD